MRYPTRKVWNGWAETEVEMTPEEYQASLDRSKDSISWYLSSGNRRDQEYGSYLSSWFSEEICDGGTFSQKLQWHRLPMTMNTYFS